MIREYAIQQLKDKDYSPEQIAGTLPSVHPGYSISPEAIYQFIYAQYRWQGVTMLILVIIQVAVNVATHGPWTARSRV